MRIRERHYPERRFGAQSSPAQMSAGLEKLGPLPLRILMPLAAYEASPFATYPVSLAALAEFLRDLRQDKKWDITLVNRLTRTQAPLVLRALEEAELDSLSIPQSQWGIDLRSDWNDHLKLLSFKTRKNIRHAFNGVEREGFRFSDTLSLPQLQELYRARHTEKDSSDYSVEKRFLEFLEELLAALHSEGRLRQVVLLQKEKPIAMCLGFTHGEALQVYQVAYDPTFAKHSPGFLALSEFIRRAFVARESQYADLMSAFEYVGHLCKDTFDYTQTKIYAPSARGQFVKLASRTLAELRGRKNLRSTRPAGRRRNNPRS